MVASAAGANVHLILQLCALGSSSQLAVLNGVAGLLEVAQSSLQCCIILILLAHAVGVDGVAVYVYGVSHGVAVVSNLRSSPGGVGDGVVDDGSGVAVVEADALVTVNGQNGSNGLAQILGLVGSGIVANLHVVRSNSRCSRSHGGRSDGW